jgi:general secretion pathway protein I
MSARVSSKRARTRGFSLLELLVAFAIMAISLSLLYRMAGGSARNVSDAAQRQQAVWLAESLLARRSSVFSDGWNEEGESAGLSWQVHSTLHDSGRNTPLAIPLHRIKVTVAWTAGTRPGQFELTTLRPQAPQPPGSTTR